MNGKKTQGLCPGALGRDELALHLLHCVCLAETVDGEPGVGRGSESSGDEECDSNLVQRPDPGRKEGWR